MMIHKEIQAGNKKADGYIIPLGPVNVVCIITGEGMIGCGAFDIAALDKYDYPAVRIRSATGKPLATLEDLLQNPVRDTNRSAAARGIAPGMSGQKALELL